MKEIWKPVVGYEGLYEVSNFGRVRNAKKSHKNCTSNENVMKLHANTKGYLKVMLYMNGQRKHLNVHRLVAKAFIKNDFNKPQINHKDGNKQNNCVDNLEWCTCAENIHHAIKTGLFNKSGKCVDQFSKDGNWISTHTSLLIAQKQTGVDRSSIQKCCNGKRKTAGGYVWKYGEQHERT